MYISSESYETHVLQLSALLFPPVRKSRRYVDLYMVSETANLISSFCWNIMQGICIVTTYLISYVNLCCYPLLDRVRLDIMCGIFFFEESGGAMPLLDIYILEKKRARVQSLHRV